MVIPPTPKEWGRSLEPRTNASMYIERWSITSDGRKEKKTMTLQWVEKSGSEWAVGPTLGIDKWRSLW